MTTTVVHVNNPDGFDIGRRSIRAKNPAAHRPSQWHNPFAVTADGYTRDEVLDLFDGIINDPYTPQGIWMREHVHELRGLRLGCWCARPGIILTAHDPRVCHGQILARWADL